ncbi:MAG: pyruvate kinase [Candidatus Krumholzibacteria bacterium]|nr:pyruvate kinase [Candidatus Krumholzibacteria bacterium]MDH4336019.1 pyruvate kinase [Candidatus Krumholzibacteria bacterium]MDH5268405.1 pyruvate kinase [Candidatus Krumholzibacteria bacterium]
MESKAIQASRRTKIVATLGPASDSPEMIEALIRAGMNVARINTSHGTRDDHARVVKNVRAVASRLGVYVPVLLDLSGPKMRIGAMAAGSAMLRAGDSFTLTTRAVPGDWHEVSISYPALVSDVSPGDRILMGDGEIELKVIDKQDADVRCEVVVGGELKSNKGVNAPGVRLRETVPTEKDLVSVEFGIKEDVDYFALSFVRSVDEVARLRWLLREKGADIPIIAKIEKKEALENIDGILDAADAVMIARGDLGLEMPIEQVPLIQKDLIRKALAASKPVITATQMLESMIQNPRPTRAEAADIANAVFDGTDAVMLSGETASGKYPVEAVRTMAEVARASEARIDYAGQFAAVAPRPGRTIPEAVAHAACFTAIEIGAKVILCCTRSGQTALYVSNHRSPTRIAVISPHEPTLKRTMLYWNTASVRIGASTDTDSMIEIAKRAVVEAGVASRGDRVVVVAGVPVDVPGTTNMIKADVL